MDKTDDINLIFAKFVFATLFLWKSDTFTLFYHNYSFCLSKTSKIARNEKINIGLNIKKYQFILIDSKAIFHLLNSHNYIKKPSTGGGDWDQDYLKLRKIVCSNSEENLLKIKV